MWLFAIYNAHSNSNEHIASKQIVMEITKVLRISSRIPIKIKFINFYALISGKSSREKRWWFSRIGLTLATLSIISNSPKFTWNWKLRSILLLLHFFWNKALWLHLFDIFPWSCSRTDVLQNFLKIDRWQYAIYGMAINKCIIMRAIRSGKSFVSALYRRKVYGPENSAQTVT